MFRSPSPSPAPTRYPAIVASVLTLIVAGLFSVALGQDVNWDLLNYHVYGPWAFLNGRLDTDLGVAGISGYLNPLLDLPHYWLIDRVPPRVLAFLMGAIQGSSALLLYRLARRLLPPAHGPLIAVFLALAGCLGSVFLSEFGNTMGDNVTAALILAALVLVVEDGVTRADHRVRWRRLAAAGVIAGIATGLKLTNAPYAVGLCIAALLCGGARSARARRFVACAAGCGAGFALSYGYWFVFMWKHYGNPFFPQFNRFFASPLAAATLVVDNKWSPNGWLEMLLFPFSFSAFPMRIHELPLVDPLWPVVYLLFVTWSIVWVIERMRPPTAGGRAMAVGERSSAASPATGRECGVDRLFVFVAVGYLLWMLVFSIGRYLVALELLLPLLAWLLLHRLIPARRAGASAVAGAAGVILIFAAALFPLLISFTTWGNADFDEAAYRVDVPTMPDPAHATVLVATAPIAWIFRSFPPELAYLALNIRFPESPGYLTRVADTLARRGGSIFAVLPVDRDARINGDSRLNRQLVRYGIARDSVVCRYIEAIFDHVPQGDIVPDRDPDAAGTDVCRFKRDFGLTPMFDRDAHDIAKGLETYGFSVDVERCTIHGAAIGAMRYRYRFCPVTRKPVG